MFFDQSCVAFWKIIYITYNKNRRRPNIFLRNSIFVVLKHGFVHEHTGLNAESLRVFAHCLRVWVICERERPACSRLSVYITQMQKRMAHLEKHAWRHKRLVFMATLLSPSAELVKLFTWSMHSVLDSPQSLNSRDSYTWVRTYVLYARRLCREITRSVIFFWRAK